MPVLQQVKGTVSQDFRLLFYGLEEIFDYNVRKLRVRVSLTMRTQDFREYLRENNIFCETVFACSYWAKVDFFFFFKGRKSLDTVLLIIDNKGTHTFCSACFAFSICTSMYSYIYFYTYVYICTVQ